MVAATAVGCPLDNVFNALQENNKVKLELDTPKQSGFELKAELLGKINCLFVNFVKYFLEEVLGVEGGIGFWSPPPMPSEGQSLDLLKLFSVVRERGGYDVVSRNGLWGLVAEELGVGWRLASSVKLVYSKHLDALRRWLETLVGAKDRKFRLTGGGGADEGGGLTQLGSGFGVLVREFLDSSKVGLDASAGGMGKMGLIDDGESTHGSARKCKKLGDGAVRRSAMDSVSYGSKECKNRGGIWLPDTRESVRMSNEDEGKSALVEIGGDKCSGGGGDDGDDHKELDSKLVKVEIDGGSQCNGGVDDVDRDGCEELDSNLLEVDSGGYKCSGGGDDDDRNDCEELDSNLVEVEICAGYKCGGGSDDYNGDNYEELNSNLVEVEISGGYRCSGGDGDDDTDDCEELNSNLVEVEICRGYKCNDSGDDDNGDGCEELDSNLVEVEICGGYRCSSGDDGDDCEELDSNLVEVEIYGGYKCSGGGGDYNGDDCEELDSNLIEVEIGGHRCSGGGDDNNGDDCGELDSNLVEVEICGSYKCSGVGDDDDGNDCKELDSNLVELEFYAGYKCSGGGDDDEKDDCEELNLNLVEVEIGEGYKCSGSGDYDEGDDCEELDSNLVEVEICGGYKGSGGGGGDDGYDCEDLNSNLVEMEICGGYKCSGGGDDDDGDDCEELKSNLVEVNISEGYRCSAGGDDDDGDDCEEPDLNLVEVEIGEGYKYSGGGGDYDDGDDCEELDSNLVEVRISSRKRKRDSICKMLNWLTGIARDPCDSEVGFLPERSNWRSYGQEEIWKQVLLAREELFKRHFESGAEQSTWQKIQKMHPCMYDDHIGCSCNLGDRLQWTKKPRPTKSSSQAQACSQASSLASQTYSESCIELNYDVESSTENAALDLPAEKYIPLGPRFQAEVPEWAGVISESDLKWIGTRVWPPANPRNELIVEREPIGQGREDSCGCQVPKSIECVRFHCAERKLRMKRELGLAYHNWRFDKMGEEVKLFWTKEEEKRFKDIVRLNPLSHDKCFWDEMIRCFPKKSKEDLVSYYFNVFHLQRRADQNRLTPEDINSDNDDDESEYGLRTKGIGREGSMSPGSLLCSARKQRKN